MITILIRNESSWISADGSAGDLFLLNKILFYVLCFMNIAAPAPPTPPTPALPAPAPAVVVVVVVVFDLGHIFAISK